MSIGNNCFLILLMFFYNNYKGVLIIMDDQKQIDLSVFIEKNAA